MVLEQNPFALDPVNVPEPADEVDVELVEESAYAKKRKQKAKPAAAAKSKLPLWLFIGGGLILLLGGIVAGVVIGGGKKKPAETVQENPNQPREPARPVNPPKTTPKDREHTSTAPKDPVVQPPPKNADPIGANPPRKADERLQLRKRWSVELGEEFRTCVLSCSSDSLVVIVASGNKLLEKALDTTTGKPLMDVFTTKSSRARYDALDGGLMAGVTAIGGRIPILDTRKKTWSYVATIPVGGSGMETRSISPNGQYVAVGQSSSPEPAPFKLKRVADGKILLEFNWVRGRIHFTGDSSRVLVAEGNGRCRWFKLPSGEPDGDWQIRKVDGRGPSGFGLFTIASDGSVCLYDGRLADRDGEYHLLDGRTGHVIRSFAGNYAQQFGSLSADGRLAALPIRERNDIKSVDVINTKTGTIVAKLAAPPNSDYVLPTLLPDGSGVLLRTKGNPNALTRYDFVRGGEQPATVEAGPLRFVERHSIQLTFTPTVIKFTSDGGSILAHDYKHSLAVIDAAAGDVRTIPVRMNLNPPTVVPMGKGKIGIYDYGRKVLDITELKTGTQIGTIPFPPLPPDKGIFSPNLIRVSGDERYVAVGMPRRNRRDPKTKETIQYPPLLVVLDTTTKKNVVELEEEVGEFFFTADSSRLLAVDRSIHGRWFTLPSGKLEKEWTFKHGADSNNQVYLGTTDRDARRMLCYYFAKGRFLDFVLDTETGVECAKFEAKVYWNRRVELSADGKRASLPRPEEKYSRARRSGCRQKSGSRAACRPATSRGDSPGGFLAQWPLRGAGRSAAIRPHAGVRTGR